MMALAPDFHCVRKRHEIQLRVLLKMLVSLAQRRLAPQLLMLILGHFLLAIKSVSTWAIDCVDIGMGIYIVVQFLSQMSYTIDLPDLRYDSAGPPRRRHCCRTRPIVPFGQQRFDR